MRWPSSGVAASQQDKSHELSKNYSAELQVEEEGEAVPSERNASLNLIRPHGGATSNW